MPLILRPMNRHAEIMGDTPQLLGGFLDGRSFVKRLDLANPDQPVSGLVDRPARQRRRARRLWRWLGGAAQHGRSIGAAGRERQATGCQGGKDGRPLGEHAIRREPKCQSPSARIMKHARPRRSSRRSGVSTVTAARRRPGADARAIVAPAILDVAALRRLRSPRCRRACSLRHSLGRQRVIGRSPPACAILGVRPTRGEPSTPVVG